jgi:succinate dehydrogenase / fumarate reductase cytochrome b subunit
MTDTRAPVERPISPFWIYRWPLPMAMSIAHRITGGALYVGTPLVAWWLLATAAGPNAYAAVAGFMGSFFGRLILFGYTWALLHHMLGGIRHLVWDLGYGFSPKEREWLSLATVIGSASLTLILWGVGYLVKGGPH